MSGLSDAIDRFLSGGQQEKAVQKTDGGRKYGPGAYLVVPDPEKPSTWKLRIEETPGKITVAQLGRAAAALGPGFRGQRVQLASEERRSAARKLIGLYRKQGVNDTDIPDYLWGIAEMKAPATKEVNMERWANTVREVFRTQYGPADNISADQIIVVEVLDEYVIAREFEPQLRHWKIPYTAEVATVAGVQVPTSITFAPRAEWSEVVPVYSEIKTIRQGDGSVRWVMISSGGFEDRDREVVSTAFLESAVKASDESGKHGPLLIYHVPGARIGECDFQAVIGKPGMLVESGTFDDTEAGRRAAAFLEGHAKEYGGSIKFLYQKRTPDGVYLPPGLILERSILPRAKAAFPWSAMQLLEVEKMAEISEEKRRELERILGDDISEAILSEVDASIETLKEAGVRYKEIDVDSQTEDNAQDSATEEQGGDAGESEPGKQERTFEVVLPPDFADIVAEKAASEAARQLESFHDELLELQTALKEMSEIIANLARGEDERLQEKLANLPRATVKARIARPTERQPMPVEDNGQDDGSFFDKAKAVLYS